MEIELEDIQHKDKLLRKMAENLSVSSYKITEPSLNSIFIHQVNQGVAQ
jgi:ABC-type uncharacterized transport system ATPase subunit